MKVPLPELPEHFSYDSPRGVYLYTADQMRGFGQDARADAVDTLLAVIQAQQATIKQLMAVPSTLLSNTTIPGART